MIFDKINTFHEYVLDGRSRTSYRLRWITKLGITCCTSWEKIE
jgi:hypothetical protein